ncbi:MAG: hypothetical protein PHF74_05585 [Dehalococcoidales bacterium]|nr:hypothetical protein [Dehalococcoidales bacterium]
MRKIFLTMALIAGIVLSPLVFQAYKAWADFSVAWDEDLPAGTEALSSGDDRMREFKTQIRERLAQDHYFIADDLTTSDTVGYHLHCTLLEQSTQPDTVADAGILYTLDTDSVATLYFRPHGAGTALRLTYLSDNVNPDSIVDNYSEQTIAGDKTFSDTVIFQDGIQLDSGILHLAELPQIDTDLTPTDDKQLTPKKYVDDQIGNDSGLYAIIVDQKDANTDGGTFTADAWRTRDLNTVQYDGIGVTVGSNQITVPAGTYYIEAEVPAEHVRHHKAILYDVTNSDTLIVGGNNYSRSTDGSALFGDLRGVVTLAAETILEIRHRCGTTQSTTGFGSACNFGVVEIYTQVFIRKIGD